MDVIRYIVAGILLLSFLVAFIYVILQPIGKYDDEPGGYEKRDGFYYPKNNKKGK